MLPPKKRRLLSWAGAFIIAIMALLFGSPTTASGCFIYRETGLYCPGCGGTRAAHHLTEGKWLDALRDNILIFPVSLFFAYLITNMILRLCGKKASWKLLKISKTQSIFIFALVIAFTIWRNLPNGSFLRPDGLNPPESLPVPPSAY